MANARAFLVATAICTLVSSPPRFASAQGSQPNWPSFRGEGASGIGAGNPPVKFDVERSENIKWRTPVEGLGHGGPVVWGSRVYIVTAAGASPQPVKTGVFGDIAPVQNEKTFDWKLLCLDLNTGAVLWNQTAAHEAAKVKRHPKSSHANGSPATDGKHVVAFFGSEGLHCFDADGKPLWHKDLGTLDAGFYVVPDAQWEFGSSPVIADDRVVVQCDVQKNAFVAAFALEDGREIWRTPRDEVPTWSTPTILRPEGKPAQVICNGHKHVAAYDLQTGKEIWALKMPGDIPIPTPVVAHDLIFLTSAHGGPSGVFAVKTSATGDISLPKGQTSGPNVAWSTNKGGSYIPTPIVVNDLLYCLNWNGVLTCFDAPSGREIYHTRLPNSEAGYTASPVAAANGTLYFVSEEGVVSAVQPGPEFKILATRPLGTKCLATPAIANDTLLFRTESALIAVAENAKPDR